MTTPKRPALKLLPRIAYVVSSVIVDAAPSKVTDASVHDAAISVFDRVDFGMKSDKFLAHLGSP
jgi:hypothetical protein